MEWKSEESRELLEKIIKLRHTLHQHAELSMQEKETREILVAFLRKELCEDPRFEIVEQERWFYVCYHSDKIELQPIAFRADFDALPIPDMEDLPYQSVHPGISHRCGHDGHSAALAGTVLLTARYGADRDIYFIFQHAEEIGGGGEECARLIPEKGISCVYAFHNSSDYEQNTIAVKNGIVHCASKGVIFSFEGKPSHASQPEQGINPAEAVSKLCLSIMDENRKEEQGRILKATIVGIHVGDQNFGISPADGTLAVTLRSDEEYRMNALQQRITITAEALAKEYQLSLKITEEDVFPETVNDERPTDDVRQAAKELGLALEEITEPFRASEDYGWYEKQCPGTIFFIGNGKNYPPFHTLKYDFNDAILPVAMEMFQKLIHVNA